MYNFKQKISFPLINILEQQWNVISKLLTLGLATEIAQMEEVKITSFYLAPLYPQRITLVLFASGHRTSPNQIQVTCSLSFFIDVSSLNIMVKGDVGLWNRSNWNYYSKLLL